jgi:hypothetical protein
LAPRNDFAYDFLQITLSFQVASLSHGEQFCTELFLCLGCLLLCSYPSRSKSPSPCLCTIPLHSQTPALATPPLPTHFPSATNHVNTNRGLLNLGGRLPREMYMYASWLNLLFIILVNVYVIINVIICCIIVWMSLY